MNNRRMNILICVTLVLLLFLLVMPVKAELTEGMQFNIDAANARNLGTPVVGVFIPDEDGNPTFRYSRKPRYSQRGSNSCGFAEDTLRLFGTCDTNQECNTKVKQLCEDDGHGGVKPGSVSITEHDDGSKTCSGDCALNGAVAFVTCNAPNKPNVIDNPCILDMTQSYCECHDIAYDCDDVNGALDVCHGMHCTDAMTYEDVCHEGCF